MPSGPRPVDLGGKQMHLGPVSVTETDARSHPWRFLRSFPAPTPEQQRTLTLECAAARVLHRVALLRSPQLPDPLRELAKRAKVRPVAPVIARRLIPVAIALYKEDPDGSACEASITWLAERVGERPHLRPVLEDARRSRLRWHRARAAVVRANLRLGASVVMRSYMRSGVSVEDLFQDAAFGLVKAADRFDPNYGVKFSTYATWWVRHAVQRALQNTMRLVRLPAHVCDSLSRCNIARHQLGDDASDEEIAARTTFPVGQVRKLTELRNTRAAHPISLDYPGVGAPEDMGPMVDLLEADLPDLDAEISVDQEVRAVESLMADLPTRTQHILERRFGLEDDQQETLAVIGERLKLSRERIRQIESGALRDLQTRAARLACPTSRV